MTNISSLYGASFNEFDSSLLLTIGDGLTQTGSTYVAGPTFNGLATYDNWLGVIGSPDPSDTVAFNTKATPSANVIEYTTTSANGDVSPASGGIGAEVIAWNATGVLLEQLTGYVPGANPVITPDGQFFILADSSVDLSLTYGSGPTTAELTFGTTGPFPTFSVPEPSTVMLMPLMVAALMVSRIPAVRSFLRAR